MTEYRPEDNLGRHKGGFKDPEKQRKAQETLKKNREEKQARKEAAKSGFGLSVASDPKEQANLINKLWKMAMGDDLDLSKFAIKMLNDMGVIKQPAEKPEEVPLVKDQKVEAKTSVEYLKQKAKEAKESNYVSDEDVKG